MNNSQAGGRMALHGQSQSVVHSEIAMCFSHQNDVNKSDETWTNPYLLNYSDSYVFQILYSFKEGK